MPSISATLSRLEPVEPAHDVLGCRAEGSGLLERRTDARNPDQERATRETVNRVTAASQRVAIGGTDDQENRHLHSGQRFSGEINTATARDDREDSPGTTRGRFERGGRTSAPANEYRVMSAWDAFPLDPLTDACQTRREALDVVADRCVHIIRVPFLTREQVHAKRGVA